MSAFSNRGPEGLDQFRRDGRQPGPQLGFRQPELAARRAYRSHSTPMRIRLPLTLSRPRAVHDERGGDSTRTIGRLAPAAVPVRQQTADDPEVTPGSRHVDTRARGGRVQHRRMAGEDRGTHAPGSRRLRFFRGSRHRRFTQPTAAQRLAGAEIAVVLRTRGGEDGQLVGGGVRRGVVELERAGAADIGTRGPRVAIGFARALLLVE